MTTQSNAANMTTAHGCSHEGHLAAIVDAVTKLADERDAYRTTLLEIAHLEDSPAASAYIAARALQQWGAE